MSEVKTGIKKENFRDSFATVSKEGKRNWVYAQQPKGKLYNIRSIVSIFYLILFFSLPLIRINETPFFLFNILERKFIFFGVTFWPQDFFIFGIGSLAFILFIVLFTVVFGRLFCGWACPQTIFMEIVFRRIEYWIEGEASHQKLLDKMPYTFSKIIKRGSKHFLFFSISFIIANTFLAYVIGTDELYKLIKEPVSQHLAGFAAIIIFTFIFYAVYAWFREQVCLIVCPYGRLQSVMTDKDSIVVAYDYVRGEPREKYNKNDSTEKGDCIDCMQCVKVCPTGIDIRNGTQLECVACTACIDACDFMMEKVDLPKGLIRYASENGIVKKEKLKLSSRMIAYSGILLGLIVFFVVLLITRNDVDAIVLRTPGMLFQKQEKNMISNLYNIKIINKTHNNIPVTLKLESGKGTIKMIGKHITVERESKAESAFFIFLPENEIKERKTDLQIAVYSGDKKLETVKTTFLGPVISNEIIMK